VPRRLFGDRANLALDHVVHADGLRGVGCQDHLARRDPRPAPGPHRKIEQRHQQLHSAALQPGQPAGSIMFLHPAQQQPAGIVTPGQR